MSELAFYALLGGAAWLVFVGFWLAMFMTGANEDRLKERLFREANR